MAEQIVEQVPLTETEPSIFHVANGMLDEVEKLGTFIQAINIAANGPAGRADLMLHHIEKLSSTALQLLNEWHNYRDCQIAACMLASDDPQVRAEARP